MMDHLRSYVGSIFMVGAGQITTPIFRDNLDLLSLTFRYGSSTNRDVKVIAIMKDNSEKIIGQFHLTGISGFVVNDYSNYKTFEYFADLSAIEFSGIKRLRIEVSSSLLKCSAPDFLIREIILDLNDRNVK